MKIRNGFISNSSSCAFIIVNVSDKKLTLVDFVKENPQLVEEYNEMYDEDYTQDDMIKSAQMRMDDKKYRAITFKPNEFKYCVFGDEQGDVIGRVFDYILRDGGTSKNFSWRFKEYLR